MSFMIETQFPHLSNGDNNRLLTAISQGNAEESTLQNHFYKPKQFVISRDKLVRGDTKVERKERKMEDYVGGNSVSLSF